MKEDNPLISVIVPVYNVQYYLDECVESIVNQTYHNLDIILVDDGSHDECPLICDSWSKKDNRIRVIHKKNGGLSSARNAGMRAASGEYLCFLDSDDFFEPNAIKDMYNCIKKDKSIGIVSGMIYRLENDEKSTMNKKWEFYEEYVVSSDEFLIKAMNLEISFTVWNKLYKKDLLEGVEFKEGRNNEDYLFMYYIGKKMQEKRYNCINIPSYVYNYRLRSESISKSKEKPLIIDILKNYIEIIQDCRNINVNLYNVIYKKYINELFQFLDSLLLDKSLKKLYFTYYRKELLKESVVKYYKYVTFKNIINIQLLKYIPELRRFARILKK